ncbi:hypothetical protein J9303_20010 [Bacillaceae bacterium Marseille-Q3522]|nr:hypothetical protein [Bacillaceae bacterium Marseille-Q3522]
MYKRKKPRFNTGDTVVIKRYGTVGKITKIIWLEHIFVYEVNKSEGLYLESSLQLISEYDGEILEKEQIDIEYKYFFGDLVQVKGHGNDIFKVVGFRTEIWRYKEDAWEDIIYELSRLSDGEWLETGEEEIYLISDANNAEALIQKLGLLFVKDHDMAISEDKRYREPNRSFRKAERELLDKAKERKEMIDGYLDMYNDYRILFHLFNDEEYRTVMRVILKKLHQLVNSFNEINRKERA